MFEMWINISIFAVMILIYNSILGFRYAIILANLRDSEMVHTMRLYNPGIALHPHKIIWHLHSKIKYYRDYDTYDDAPADRAVRSWLKKTL